MDIQYDSNFVKKIGVELAFIFGDYNFSINKWWDEYRSNDDIELKKDLGMLPFANIFMTDFYKKKNFISFGGAALGQNYQIHTGFKPEFGMNKLVRFVQNLKRGFFHRFLSTKAFIYLLNFPIIIKSLELIFNMRGRLPKNQLDYLAFLSISATTPFYLLSIQKYFIQIKTYLKVILIILLNCI